MRKKTIMTMAMALALIGTIGMGATLAYFTDSDSAENVITMGHVAIRLTEETNDPLAITEEGLAFSNIVPGEQLSKKPIITVANDSKECYLRAKIELVGLDEDHETELMEQIDLDATLWTLGDEGYYYYQQMAVPKQAIPLFTTVSIPSGWGNEVADTTFRMNITAEAIQASHFEPEMRSGIIYGWQDVIAESYQPSSEQSE